MVAAIARHVRTFRDDPDARALAARRVVQDVAAVRDWCERVHYRSRSAFFVMLWTVVAMCVVAAVLVSPWAAAAPAVVLYAATVPARWTVRSRWRRQCLYADVYKLVERSGRVHTQDWRQRGFTTGAKWQQVLAYRRELTPKLRQVKATALGWTAVLHAAPGQTCAVVEKRADRLAAGMWHKVVVRPTLEDGGVGTLVILRVDPFGPDAIRQHPGLRGRTDMWDVMPFGFDELGQEVYVPLVGESWLIGGLLGSGKSVTATNIIAHAALDPTVPLYICDGAGTDMRPFVECIDPADPDSGDYAGQDAGRAIEVLTKVWAIIERRQADMASGGLDHWRRKIERGQEPPVLLVMDEWATYRDSCTDAQRKRFDALLHKILSNYRKTAVVPVLITQQPRFDVVPPKIRNLCSQKWAGHVGSDGQSDIILGDGWADDGISAKDIPDDHVGVGYLTSGGRKPYLVRSFYLDDDEVKRVALRAADLRGEFRRGSQQRTLERV